MYCISLHDRQSVQWIGSYPVPLDGVVVAGGRRQLIECRCHDDFVLKRYLLNVLGELGACNFGIVGNDGSILQTPVKANNAREHETFRRRRVLFLFSMWRVAA